MPGRARAKAAALLAEQPTLFGELRKAPRPLREEERRLLTRLAAEPRNTRLRPFEEKAGLLLSRRGLVTLNSVKGLAGFAIERHAGITTAGLNFLAAP